MVALKHTILLYALLAVFFLSDIQTVRLDFVYFEVLSFTDS